MKLLNHLITGLKLVYPKNIILDEIKIAHHLYYLDMEIYSLHNDNYDNFVIHHNLYEKPQNKKNYLHFKSNHTLKMKQSIIISQLYRSAVLNSSSSYHESFKIKLFNHIIKYRNYTPYIIRKTSKSKWIYRNSYLKKMRKKQLFRLEKALLVQYINIDINFQFIQQHYHQHLIKKHYHLNEEKQKIIIFKKYCNILYYNDSKLGKILHGVLEFFPYKVQKSIKPLICNKIKKKISKYIHSNSFNSFLIYKFYFIYYILF